jgi:hypothetical protein
LSRRSIKPRLWPALVVSSVALAQAPAIAPRGIVNAASRMPTSLPGGKLAAGARILIPGVRLTAAGSPSVIHLKSGAWNASIAPANATETQIEADLPADLPAGDVQISVETAAGLSRAETVPAAASSPGIYTLNEDGWGPVSNDPVRRKKKALLRINGLNDAHPKVFIGGVAARVASRHGQELTIEIPANAPQGCWTPVWIESAPGVVSNFATLRIVGHQGARHGDCLEPAGWPLRPVAAGKRAAIVIGTRIQGSIETRPGQPQDFTLDSAAGFFFRAAEGRPTPFQALPPAGTCTSYTGKFSLIADLLFLTRHFIGEFNTALDMGKSMTITNGERTASLREKKVEGQYSGSVGGVEPVIWTGTPLFFVPGEYHVRTAGSSIDIPLRVPPAFEWANQSDVQTIDRSTGVRIRWSGLAADQQMLIAAFNVHPDTSAMGTCLCVAPAGATEMEIPPYALANFPPTERFTPVPIRGLILAAIPRSNTAVSMKGFDDVRSAFLHLRGQTIQVR